MQLPNFASSSPSAFACAVNCATSRAGALVNKLSCICQYLPWSPAQLAASCARDASGMELRNRVVDEDVFHLAGVDVVGQDLGQGLQRLAAAERAVIVRDLDECDLGGGIAAARLAGKLDRFVDERIARLPLRRFLQDRLDGLEIPLHRRLLRLQFLQLAFESGDFVRLRLWRRQRQQRQETDERQFQQHGELRFYQNAHGKILPGLRMPSGSNARLTRFISAISSSDNSSGR